MAQYFSGSQNDGLPDLDQPECSTSSTLCGTNQIHINDTSNTNTNNNNNNNNKYNNSIMNASNSNYVIVSSLATMDFDSLNDIVIDEILEAEPTSAILDFCKRKFLLPYVKILGCIGLRPITIDSSRWGTNIGHIQTSLIILLLIIGYLCQYVTHFRRDRGFIVSDRKFYNLTYSPFKEYFGFNELLFVYMIPCIIHFLGFITAVYVFRIADNEQIQNLVERVFILSNMPRKLFYILWVYLICGFTWLILMTIYNFILEDTQTIVIKVDWIKLPPEQLQLLIKWLLTIGLFCHDLTEVIVLSNYSIQCYLLRCYLNNVKDKLLQHTIEPIEWMKEMTEFRKLLQYLNKIISLPVCFFIILNIIYIFSALIYLFTEYILNATPIKLISFDVGNILLWLFIGLYPFFQAASLTASCRSVQSSGHQIRIRPFVYHNTSVEELNSVLLYASSLQLSATLFHMSIKESFLFCILLCIIVVILALGMCLNIYVGIT